MSSSYIGTLETIAQHITIYLGISIMIVGICGESLNIIVFLSLRTFRQSACAFYLTVMSIVDICQLLSGLLARLMTSGFAIDWSTLSLFYCKFRFYLYHVSALSAASCFCLAVIDQYLATCDSPYWQRWSSIRVAHRLVGCIIVFWIVYNTPFLVFYSHVFSARTKQVSCMLTDPLFSQYNNYVHRFALGKLLPICVTVIFGVLAFRNVRQMVHRALPVVRRELDKQLTVMVLLQAVSMLCTNVPYIIAYLLQTSPTLTSDPLVAAQVQFMVSVTVCILYMSYATPFYLYCCASHRFRRQLRYVLFDIHINRCREQQIADNQVVPTVS